MERSIPFCFSVICFVLKSYQSLANNRVVWVIQFYYGRLTPQQFVAIIQLLSKSVIRYANTKRITVNSLVPHSSHLTAPDIFLREYLKSKAYANKSGPRSFKISNSKTNTKVIRSSDPMTKN